MVAPASVLNRDAATLVVVDIQERLAVTMQRRDQVVAATELLIRVASIVGAPIVATRQYPKGLGGLEPELEAALAEAEAEGTELHRIDKLTFDCFSEPEFADAVSALNRKQLLIAGMETHICIAQTALSGVRAGFDVHVAADACCSRAEENRSLALSRLSQAGVVVSSTESAAYEMVGRAGTDEFKRLLAAVKG